MINSLLPIDGAISIYRDCSIAIGNENPSQAVVLDVAKGVLTNAKKMCDAILKGRLTQLDPIVGENACQIRALFAICASLEPELKKELSILSDYLQKKLMIVNVHQNKTQLATKGTLLEQLEALQLSISVSETVDYLCRSHFLTIGKSFCMNRNGNECSKIIYQDIKNRLSTKMESDLLEKMVKIAQEKIACDSIKFLQSEAVKLDIKTYLDDGAIRVIDHMEKQLHSSCALFNLKAVLLRVKEMNVPILVKEYKDRKELKKSTPVGIYFCSDQRVEKGLDKEQQILVVECFFPEGYEKETLAKSILENGLDTLILANAACTPQYSADDDISCLELEAQEEILKYRSLGKELGCDTASPVIFKVAHVHAATVKEEKVV